MRESGNDIPTNPFADWPLHRLLFVQLGNGAGGLAMAQTLADRHGISLDELKAYCRLAGSELVARGGTLDAAEQRVYEWAAQ